MITIRSNESNFIYTYYYAMRLYFYNTIDVLFTTCNQDCNQILIYFVEPNVICRIVNIWLPT